MGSASSIPYQLRPNKAVERNLFIAALKILGRNGRYDLSTYRYVGFGAPFLEDFKQLHNEFGIVNMDCIEYDYPAYTRQSFNHPYNFLNIINVASTDYITGTHFKSDINQLIWLDYATPSQLHQQLLDLEMLGEKLYDGDIVKITFNANPRGFKDGYGISDLKGSTILDHMQNSSAFNKYVPAGVKPLDAANNFSGLLRTMGTRAIERGLGKGIRALTFTPISCFQYSDGQTMTTILGIITMRGSATSIIKTTQIDEWEFFTPYIKGDLVKAHKINVPAMTSAERIEIDRHVPVNPGVAIGKLLPFVYEDDQEENDIVLQNYCRFYKYLPHFSRTTY